MTALLEYFNFFIEFIQLKNGMRHAYILEEAHSQYQHSLPTVLEQMTLEHPFAVDIPALELVFR